MSGRFRALQPLPGRGSGAGHRRNPSDMSMISDTSFENSRPGSPNQSVTSLHSDMDADMSVSDLTSIGFDSTAVLQSVAAMLTFVVTATADWNHGNQQQQQHQPAQQQGLPVDDADPMAGLLRTPHYRALVLITRCALSPEATPSVPSSPSTSSSVSSTIFSCFRPGVRSQPAFLLSV
eukprot:1348184-Rhodomonas_salina.1